MRRTASVLLCILLVAVLGSARDVAAEPKTKRADAPYPADFQARVREAIRRGVDHLRTRQLVQLPLELVPESLRHGHAGVEYEGAAAMTWVLRRAGVPPTDPAFTKTAKVLGARLPTNADEAALLLLALCVEPLPQGNPFALPAPVRAAAGAAPLSGADRVLMERTVAFVLGRQVKDRHASFLRNRVYDSTGGWGSDLGGRASSDQSDVATTYMVLLGLEAASRHGAAIQPRTWIDALGLLVGWQAQKGAAASLKMNEVRGAERFEWTEPAKLRGFGYAGTLSDKPTGNETAAGAIGLMICQDALQAERAFTRELREQTRLGIRDALAWVQQHYDIAHNPAPSRGSRSPRQASRGTEDIWYHHWLQGLARLAIHARMRFLGSHDWYQEGAEHLLKTQMPGGSWSAIWWSNCYPLLFLLRASVQSIVPVVTPGEGSAVK